jgi:hypothetical protein
MRIQTAFLFVIASLLFLRTAVRFRAPLSRFPAFPLSRFPASRLPASRLPPPASRP